MTASISPTKPRSGLPGAGASLCAVSRRPSLPDRPIALPPSAVEQADDLGVDLPVEHHLDDAHVLGAGDALAVGELGLVPHPLQRLGDLGAAAVDDDRSQPGRLQQHHLLGEAALQRRIDHRRAAVLDDGALAGELADVAERLDDQRRG